MPESRFKGTNGGADRQAVAGCLNRSPYVQTLQFAFCDRSTKFQDYWFSGCVRRARARFETARFVFDDPHCITFVERIAAGEEHWHAIGSLENIIIIVVVHTYREETPDEIIRIISARRATRHERGLYVKANGEKKKELQRLAARPDREIDLPDIPEIREFPSDAVIGKLYRPKRASVTMRIDADVLAWLRSSGEGYQTRINEYLRRLMRRSRKR